MNSQSALELAQTFHDGTNDPVQALEAVRSWVEADVKSDHIYTRLTWDRAYKEAEASHKRYKADAPLSPLDGVPVSWKDLFDTAGVATEAGSNLLAGRVPEKDALVLQNATQAGTVCIGKTHLSELAFSGLGINPKAATAPNSNGEGLVPGGSSSGAASSVAFSHVPIGIGSDTGGSVRIPSCWQDLVGFKTTHGWLPLEGAVPLCAKFDTVGPLCNSLADAWTMTAIMAGEAPSLPEARPLSQSRFLVAETIMLDDLPDDRRAAFEAAVDRLGAAGAMIERGPVPEYETLGALGPILFPHEAWQIWGETIAANPGVMFAPIEARFRSGEPYTAQEYDQAWMEMIHLRGKIENRMVDYDAVLAPTVAIDPPEVQLLLDDHAAFGAANLMALRNTRLVNMTGGCAFTLPLPEATNGLMVIKSAGEDRALASVGLGMETAVM